jgi:nitrate/nitrite transport system ATP-binding protein
VDLARPRDRKAINHDPRFKEIRNEVIAYLTGPGKRRSLLTEVSGPAKAPVPDLEPVDLTARTRFSSFRRKPVAGVSA